jgi:hypothetical protein
MRAIKASLEQLLKRIESEARASAQRDERLLVSELRKTYAEDIAIYAEIRRKLDVVEERLDKGGLRIINGIPGLNHKKSCEIHDRHEKHQHRFRVMRNNIIIRTGLSDNDERKSMMRHFFDEVLKVYPTLQSVLGKLKP